MAAMGIPYFREPETLAADRYSKQCAPGTGAKRTKQNPPPKQP